MALRCWEPVGLLVLARALVLKIKREPAVRVIFEWHPAAHRKTIEAVGHLKTLRVVERDRPERVDGRGRAPLEDDRIFAVAVPF